MQENGRPAQKDSSPWSSVTRQRDKDSSKGVPTVTTLSFSPREPSPSIPGVLSSAEGTLKATHADDISGVSL